VRRAREKYGDGLVPVDTLRRVEDAAVDTRPLGRDDLGDLASLFKTQRNTRACWCMAFCTTSAQFTVGWVTGGNRRRFEAMASESGPPMGILASMSGEPVGWCACGPRSRYLAAMEGRSSLLKGLKREEDEAVWLLPCLFVRPENRSQGVSFQLIRAAIELARLEGASAIEGWPAARSDRRASYGFVGRETVFEDLGFQCIVRPSPDRAIVRLDLTSTKTRGLRPGSVDGNQDE
jgi:GNAT superfamily N-acetyltransferase